MHGALNPLTLQFLEWIAIRPRTYTQAMEAWRTSCPRQSIWEDALLDGLIQVSGKEANRNEPVVILTELGKAQLERNNGL